jgi:hypothetical protein
VDEAGFLPLGREDANGLFQIVNRRSTIVTSNESASEWAELLGDEVFAAAILDRLLPDAEVLTSTAPPAASRADSRSCARPPPKPRMALNDPEFSVASTRARAQIASQRLTSAATSPKPAETARTQRPLAPPQSVAAA